MMDPAGLWFWFLVWICNVLLSGTDYNRIEKGKWNAFG
jgi:hypothetical protein